MQMTSEVAKFSYQSECFRHDLGLLTTIKVSDKECYLYLDSLTVGNFFLQESAFEIMLDYFF